MYITKMFVKCLFNNEFIFFGCWNESYCNSSKPTLSGSSQVINNLINKKDNPLFYIVAGDNYYPRKDKDKGIKEYSNLQDEFNGKFFL